MWPQNAKQTNTVSLERSRKQQTIVQIISHAYTCSHKHTHIEREERETHREKQRGEREAQREETERETEREETERVGERLQEKQIN